MSGFCRELRDVAYWRNNLAAASNRYNYLFIGLRAEIHVYAPLYPYQTLPAHPISVLASEPSQRSTGYIDRRHPHAINSLTIGELGSEEVLVSAHDDGDVCVWYTSNLQRMALQLSVGQSAWGVALHKERRLLAVSANSHLITVFELAVGGAHAKPGEDHEQSGHAGEEEDEAVTFETQGGFTFESVRRRRKSWSGKKTDALRSPDGYKKRPKREATKDKTLEGHGNNIPNIAFLDDSSGRWLVGTAIDGMVILWDVHTEKMVEKCKLGTLHKGWSVLLLKPQGFKPMSSVCDALDKVPAHKPAQSRRRFSPGSDEEPEDLPARVFLSGVRTIQTEYYLQLDVSRVYGGPDEARAWDITPATTANMGQGHYPQQPEPLYEVADYDEDDALLNDYSNVNEEELELSVDLDGGEVEEDSQHAPPPIPPILSPPTRELVYVGDGWNGESDSDLEELEEGLFGDTFPENESDDHADPQPSESDFYDSGSDGLDVDEFYDEVISVLRRHGPDSEGSPTRHANNIAQPSEHPRHHSGPDGLDVNEFYDEVISALRRHGPDSEGSPTRHANNIARPSEHPRHPGFRRSEGHKDQYSDEEELEGKNEPKPITPPLAFVFATTEHNAYLIPTTPLSPTVICRSFLHQSYPPMALQYLGDIDRLNMVHQIPELSLVIAASQKGRVGIFRLTRARGNFGMRLDMILPRESGAPKIGASSTTLDVETRPAAALLGLAVSPVQGRQMEDGKNGGGWRGIEGRRRWRLMMIYTDGNMLSYELGGGIDEAGDGLGVDLGLGGEGFVMV